MAAYVQRLRGDKPHSGRAWDGDATCGVGMCPPIAPTRRRAGGPRYAPDALFPVEPSAHWSGRGAKPRRHSMCAPFCARSGSPTCSR